jgi:hypothetical protein
MGKKVNIEMGGEAGSQCRWSCLYCGTMGPWTSQTIAISTGEAHGNQHRDEVQDVAQHRDEALDEILQNMKIPIENEPPPNTQST